MPSGPPGPTAPSASGLLSNRQIGDVNRSRVLRTLCDHGPLSRAALARLTHVPRATIGTIAQGLVDDGLLEEMAPLPSSGRVGKPGRPLWFRADAGLCLAVDFRPTAVHGALVNARGEVLADARRTLDTTRATSAELVEAVLGVVRDTSPDGPGDTSGVLGVGIAVPGVCDPRTGEVMGSGPVPGAVGRALHDALHAATGLRVLVDNDARAQALGEKWFGEGRGVDRFVAVQTGTGLGVGLVLDGEVYRGHDGATSELGHVQVTLDGEACHCGLQGCWETVATLPWLRTQAAALGLPEAPTLDAARLVALAGAAAPGARALLDRYADHLAIGLATLVHLLAPRRFLLHGDAVGGGETLRSAIAAALAERTLPHLRPGVEVVLSRLDTDAALLGAAGLVLSERFSLAA